MSLLPSRLRAALSDKKQGSDGSAQEAPGEIFHSALTLIGGAGIAQAVLFLSYPLLSRLYTTSDFGILAVFTGLLQPLVVAGSLRLEGAIPLPRVRHHAVVLAALCAAISLALTALIAAAVLIVRPHLSASADYAPVAQYLWLLPAAFLAGASYRWLNAWLVRLRHFTVVARATVAQGFSVAATQVGFGAGGFGPVGLLLGQVFGPALGAFVMARRSLPDKLERSRVTVADALAQLKRYSAFPKFSAPQVVINSLGQNLPGLLFASFFGLQVAGLYLLAHRVLRQPADLVGEAFRQAYYPRANEAVQQRHGQRLAMRSTLALAAVALVPALAVFALAEPAFALLFGDNWRPAGAYASILIPFVFSAFVNIPSVSMIPILGLQGFQLATEVLVLGLRCSAILVGASMHDDYLAVALFSLAGVLANIVVIGYVLRRVGRSDREASEPGVLSASPAEHDLDTQPLS